MNRFVTTTTLILLCSATSFFAIAQSDSSRLLNISTKLQKQTVANPVEKVYLQLNKPNYLTGDTIWFKAYLTVGPLHKPSALSGIIYVELIDQRDKIIKTLTLKNTNGIGIGDIALANDLSTGNYRLRAYTTWMRNAGPTYFFTQNFMVGNLKSNLVYVNAKTNATDKNMPGQETATLKYTDKFGRPFDHKTVSYEVA